MAPPHSDQNPMRALLLITTSDAPTLKAPSRWSKAFNDFLAQALQKEPQDRPSASEMLEHDFIRSNPDPDAMVKYVKAQIASGATEMAGAEFEERNGNTDAFAEADDDDDEANGWSSASTSARTSVRCVLRHCDAD